MSTLYVIRADSEDGWWSNDLGWVGDLASATRFEHTDVSLPFAAGSDARWARQADTIKVVVLCTSSDGAPEFHTCELSVTDEQYAADAHYQRAIENAEWNGYEHPMLAFDAHDPAAKQLGELLAWI